VAQASLVTFHLHNAHFLTSYHSTSHKHQTNTTPHEIGKIHKGRNEEVSILSHASHIKNNFTVDKLLKIYFTPLTPAFFQLLRTLPFIVPQKAITTRQQSNTNINAPIKYNTVYTMGLQPFTAKGHIS